MVIEKKEDTAGERGLYELGYHLLPTIVEENVGAEVTKVKDLVESHGGIVVSDGFPKMMNLAYTVVKRISNKNNSFKMAYFGWMRFEAKRDKLPELKEALEGAENILRFLLVNTTHEKVLAPKRMPFLRARPSFSGKKESAETKPEQKMTEEEMDKTIEELVGQ